MVFESTIFIATIIGAIIIGWLLLKLRRSPKTTERAIKHRENVKKVLNMAQVQDKITNNDVENALGISDATATRYLEELEQEGKIQQVGREGRHVFYRAIR